MRLVTIFACILVACGPLLVSGQKKMIFVIPRTVRRAHSPSWRQFTRPQFTKMTKFLDKEFFPSQHKNEGHPFPNDKFTKSKPIIFNQNRPHHADNFDQVHEKVNHVVVPQGKGISHAFDNGNGYIPHEPMKDAGFTDAPRPLDHTDYHLNYYSHPQVTQQMDNYLHRDEDAHQHDNHDGMQERTTDHQRAKYFLSKNLEKPYNQVIYEIPKKPYFSSASLYNKDKSILTAGGIPGATLGGSKEGIVLQDSIDLGHYQKKLMELASTWPGGLHISPGSALSTAVTHGSIAGIGGTSQQLSGHFQPNNFGGFNFLSSGYPPAPLNSQQGYAVQEDVQEEMPHDFRTQPIQTAPASHPQDIIQAAVPQSQFGISSAPFMPSLQFPGAQGFQGLSEHLRG